MKTIAVLVYDLTVEYNITVVDGILSYFRDKPDVRVLVSQVKTPHDTRFEYDYMYWTCTELYKSKEIEAVIFVTNSFCYYLTAGQFSDIISPILRKPSVSVGTALNIPECRYTCVSCRQAYDNVVRHLIQKHNRKRIAFFSASKTESPESFERVNAYKEALAKNGLEIHEDWIFPGDFTPKTSYEFIMANFKTKEDLFFDAILCANDYMATGTISAFRDLGIKVPQDVCVFGFDDTEISLASTPTVSTINQQLRKTGSKASEVALKIVEGKETEIRNEIDSFPVYRQSCGCIDYTRKSTAYVDNDGIFHEQQSVSMNFEDFFGNRLDDLAKIYNLMNMTDTVTSIDVFFEALLKNLGQFYVPRFAICVYKEDIHLDVQDDFTIPDEARLLILVDTDNNEKYNFFEKEEIYFNPLDSLLPAQYNHPEYGNYFVEPIFLRDTLYGYFICQIPNDKYTLYAIFTKFFMSAFIHAYEYSRKEIQRKKLIQENLNLNMQSKTDELTQVFNRKGFYEYGQRLITLSAGMGKSGTVFFCDLDGLKKINDTWGHETGDLAIKTEAQVLKAVFRNSDLIGRLSGDEFGVIAPGFSIDRMDILRNKLKETNEKFSKENKLPFTLSISIGPQEFSGSKSNLQELLAAADKMLYEEKKIKHPERYS